MSPLVVIAGPSAFRSRPRSPLDREEDYALSRIHNNVWLTRRDRTRYPSTSQYHLVAPPRLQDLQTRQANSRVPHARGYRTDSPVVGRATSPRLPPLAQSPSPPAHSPIRPPVPNLGGSIPQFPLLPANSATPTQVAHEHARPEVNPQDWARMTPRQRKHWRQRRE